MNKISVKKLFAKTAVVIQKEYLSPPPVRLPQVWSNVEKAGNSTDRLLAMSTMVVNLDKEYYLTFKEVKISGRDAVLLMEGSIQEAEFTAGLFETNTRQVLATVRLLIKQGYPNNRVDLTDYNRVYKCQGQIVQPSLELAKWAKDKLDACDSLTGAKEFDLCN